MPIDPADLETTLRVLRGMADLDEDHPDFVAVRQATAKMFKAVKKARRLELRAAVADADRAVVAATATGAPDRIDDETRGIPLEQRASAPTAGTLIKARACYICKQPVHPRRRLLPPALPGVRGDRATPSAKRAPTSPASARCSPAAARRSACTSRCACCGMARTPRSRRAFPRDAVRRFTSLPDSPEWIDRLKVVGIDLRDPAQVIGLAD